MPPGVWAPPSLLPAVTSQVRRVDEGPPNGRAPNLSGSPGRTHWQMAALISHRSYQGQQASLPANPQSEESAMGSLRQLAPGSATGQREGGKGRCREGGPSVPPGAAAAGLPVQLPVEARP